jgi:hypothetical protein
VTAAVVAMATAAAGWAMVVVVRAAEARAAPVMSAAASRLVEEWRSGVHGGIARDWKPPVSMLLSIDNHHHADAQQPSSRDAGPASWAAL